MDPIAQTNHRPRRPSTRAIRPAPVAIWLLGLVLAVVPATQAAAQTASLPDSVVTSITIGTGQNQALSDYVATRLAELDSGDPAAFVRASSALNDPLTRSLPPGQSRSFAFRRAYESLLASEIDSMLASDEPARVYLGMRLSGNLATDQSARRLQRMLAPDQDAPVRLFAASMLRSSFEVLIGSRSMSESQAIETLEAIREAALGEPSPLVADAYARTLITAGNVTGEDLQRVGPTAMQILAVVTGPRARAVSRTPADLDELVPVVRALKALQDVMIRPTYPYSEDMLRESVGLSADVMAYLIGRQNAALDPLTEGGGDAISGERKPLDVVMMSLAENTETYARGHMARLKGTRLPAPRPRTLTEYLEQAMNARDAGDRRKVLTDLQSGFVTNLLDTLSQPPFNMDRNRFLERLN